MTAAYILYIFIWARGYTTIQTQEHNSEAKCLAAAEAVRQASPAVMRTVCAPK